VAAARLALPARVLVTGVTALWCFGVEVGPPRPLQFVTDHPHQVRRPRLLVSRTGRLPPSRGRSVVAEHAFAVAARRLNLLEMVTAGDWLVRLRLTTPERLAACSYGYRGAGAALARRAAVLVRQRVDSPGESRLRLGLVLAGLSEAQCNVTLGTDTRSIGESTCCSAEWSVLFERLAR
jgi:hypothetical protein